MRIFFFKINPAVSIENERKIDVELLNQFFEEYSDCNIKKNNTELQAKLKNNKFGYELLFNKVNRIAAPNIWKLDPKFVNTNLIVDIEEIYSTFVFGKIFEVIKKLAKQFDLYLYHESLEKITDCDLKVYQNVYNKLRDENNQLASYTKAPKEVVIELSSYNDKLENLRTIYEAELIEIPEYIYFKNQDNELRLAISWDEGSRTVFPPYIDYVLYNTDKGQEIYPFNQIKELLLKDLVELKEFSKNALKLDVSKINKVSKLMKKFKFNEMTEELTKINFTDIIDK